MCVKLRGPNYERRVRRSGNGRGFCEISWSIYLMSSALLCLLYRLTDGAVYTVHSTQPGEVGVGYNNNSNNTNTTIEGYI